MFDHGIGVSELAIFGKELILRYQLPVASIQNLYLLPVDYNYYRYVVFPPLHYSLYAREIQVEITSSKEATRGVLLVI